jgi:hypothetical protein
MQMSPRSLLLSYLGVKNRVRTKKATFQNEPRSFCSFVGRVKDSPTPSSHVLWHIKVWPTLPAEIFGCLQLLASCYRHYSSITSFGRERVCTPQSISCRQIHSQCASCKSQCYTHKVEFLHLITRSVVSFYER